ncbi:MAG: MFS transporter [Clostridia bacterium]|nr:MFS transporter [Clostridia bacterium]
MNTAHQDRFQHPAYQRSRRAYCLECMFEYFVSLLVTETFLAKLLSNIGMSDALIGVISSFISVAFLFQLLTVLVVDRITNTKRVAMLFHSASQLFFMALYLVPFLPIALPYKSVLVVVFILLAYFGNYFVTSLIYKWGNSFVEPTKRATFSAVKESVSLLSGMAVTLILGFVMDVFEANHNLEGGFLFAAAGILIFSLCDFICLSLMKSELRAASQKKGETAVRATEEKIPLREVMKNTLGNRNFRNVMILYTLWNVSVYTTVGFLGTYRVKELAFALGTVQLINVFGSLARALISRPMGVFSDRFSFSKGIALGMILVSLAFLMIVLTTPESRFLLIAYTLLYQIGQSGTGQNFLNITYSYVDARYFVQATALKNSVGGLFGFLASLGAGQLLKWIQQNGNSLFGIHVYGQQVLACISLVLMIAAFLFNILVVQKQKIMIQ